MKIGLVDVDGHNFPNLALMRMSAYYKLAGAQVEWWKGNLFHYDTVFKSKVFGDEYSTDDYDVWNADRVVLGGTGYAIRADGDKEVYEKSADIDLPTAIERMKPDYSIYPEYAFAVSMTSRGCPRGCPFCIVGKKEGRKSVKVADVSDFWNGQSEIKVLDPNILACEDKRDLLDQYIQTKVKIDFNQGLDIRMMDGKDIEDLNNVKMRYPHFAWDNPNEDLTEKFKEFAKGYKHKCDLGMVYVLVNYNSTMEQNLYRIYTLRDLGYDPYVMVYRKPTAQKEILALQRWCNNKVIFKSCRKFEDYRRL